MDEPFAALDEITRFKLNDDLLRMWQALRTTVVFVTHSVFEVGLSVDPHRGDGGAAGPHLHRSSRSTRPTPRGEHFRTSAGIRGCCAGGLRTRWRRRHGGGRRS